MAEVGQTLLSNLQKERKERNLPALLKREFQAAAAGVGSENQASRAQPTIRVMQWNLLAQALSQGDDNFVLCSHEALQWDNRKLHIMEEVLTYKATIICLEEVDHFSYMQELLATAGYAGCFFPKPDSPCLYSYINNGPDGCAVFWRSDEVRLEIQKDIVLKDYRHHETNQVAILCKFTHVGLKRELYVAVTHLKSKSPYWQLRHDQGKYLEQVLAESVTASTPLIVCGDFNAEPSEKVYATFQSSKLNLNSAYCHLSDKLEEPAYTTWKVRGGPTKGTNVETAQCIDYMWFTRNHLQPVSLLKLPTSEEVGEDRLPSMAYPSDHLSLVVDFVFKS